jgi:hypothetical protein
LDGIGSVDCHLNGADLAKHRGLLLNVARQRDPCHHLIERSPQCEHVRPEVEVPLAQCGLQVQLLLFGHQLFSSVSASGAGASCFARVEAKFRQHR